jgi:hypothetical protein
MRRWRIAKSALVTLLASACSEQLAPAPPLILQADLLANPTSVVAARAVVRTARVDSLRVLYGTAALTDTTPFQMSRGAADTVDVLGLTSNTSWTFVVEVMGPGGARRSEPRSLTTGALPADLAAITLDVTGGASSTGPWLLSDLAAGPRTYAFVFDRAGVIRWYRGFESVTTGGAVVTQQRNGNFTIYLGLSRGFEPTYGSYAEFTPAGSIVRTWAAPAPWYTDDHELLLTGAHGNVEAVHMLAYEIRRTDLTSKGGAPDALLAGHYLLRLDPAGAVRFFWSGWDNISLADWIEPTGVSADTDFDHPNAVDIDGDGGYVVSFRATGEVMKVDAATGAYRWRFGGAHSQFTIIGDPLGLFSGQHSVRMTGPNRLLMFDNGLRHVPSQSRAVEYQLDTLTHSATMLWEYRHTPALFSPTRGSAVRLANGHTVIGFGVNAVTTDVDGAGTVTWEATLKQNGQPAAFYRMTPIASLYQFRSP